MIIGFDGKRAVNNMTGIGNYSRLVIGSLAEEYPSTEFFVYTPKLKENPRLKTIRELHNVQFRIPPASGFGGSLWRTFGITNNLGPDKVNLYHGLSNELPLNIKEAGIPTVVTIHDLIWRVLPHTFSAVDRMIDDFKYSRSCRNATRIIAISENTKRDIVKFYDINPDKIDVVYQGCDDSFKRRLTPLQLEETRRRLRLPDKYILQVGTVEERKNLESSVRALSTLPPEIKLLAIGKDRRGYMDKVKSIARDLGVSDRVVFRSDISFTDLPAVYQMARVVVYPSRYEGFGIPCLEALESERPLVAATGSCLEEAGGPDSIYIDPENPRQLGEAVLSIISGSKDCAEMICRGKNHAAKFDNAAMATRIMEVYEKTICTFS